jgi:hypothetical protein
VPVNDGQVHILSAMGSTMAHPATVFGGTGQMIADPNKPGFYVGATGSILGQTGGSATFSSVGFFFGYKYRLAGNEWIRVY